MHTNAVRPTTRSKYSKASGVSTATYIGLSNEYSIHMILVLISSMVGFPLIVLVHAWTCKVKCCIQFLLSLQYTEEEFDLDVESVFDLIQKTPPMFGEVLTPSTAARAIQEAFEVLNSSKTGQLCTSAECNLVISLLQQWLVRHLCKRLMQLMTPEALILHRNKIPYTYLQNYLAFQTHFSLSDLVNNYHRKLKHTIG